MRTDIAYKVDDQRRVPTVARMPALGIFTSGRGVVQLLGGGRSYVVVNVLEDEERFEEDADGTIRLRTPEGTVTAWPLTLAHWTDMLEVFGLGTFPEFKTEGELQSYFYEYVLDGVS